MKNLIIVESPAKARTIKNFLGKDYEVIASKGHIRDLPKYTLGIEIKQGQFIPKYTIDKDHTQIVSEIKTKAKSAKTTYIATDEDREGEAIGYHITQTLGADTNNFPRIVFHEITKSAIQNALENPRTIDMDKVNAQQARRLLDRIVGFKLSNLISAKIARGLSAGRVQSAALKLVIDKEREIQAFKSVTYFIINATFCSKQGNEIESELVFYDKALEKLSLQNEKEVKSMVDSLKKQDYQVFEITKKIKKTPTPPPFMTSTLQQNASNKLGFSPSRTMSIAQKLYEGVQTHSGVMGVITYMRTDSLNIAKEAQNAARKLLESNFGKDYVPSKPKNYTTKSKSAQEAHEAIRPTNLDFTPTIAKDYLKPDELKLYKLIYERFLSSQSVDAEFESQSIIFSNAKNTMRFKANGRRLVFDGFYKILGVEDKDELLPTLNQGDKVQVKTIKENKKQTEPPARFSEASLIKTLESLGIGRPSTYAPTISLLLNREYLINEKKSLIPQESAFKVIEMLEKAFNEIVDSSFSASLEDKLDDIASKKRDWNAMLWEFYEPFMEKLEQGKQNIASQKIAIPTGELCPKCNKELVQRNGKFGEFIACSGYPKCKYIKPTQKQTEQNLTDEVCEKCGKPMVRKFSKRGEFIACSGYPECKNTKPLNQKPKEILSVKCPECGGEIIKRFSKRGAFYGCGNYPKCTFLSKYPLIEQKCQKCGGAMVEREFRKQEIYECLKCKDRVQKE